MLNDKNSIRKDFLLKRLQLSREEVVLKSDAVATRAYTEFFLLKGNIGLYFPFKNEVDPLLLMKFGVVNVSFPVIQGEDIVFKKWQEGDALNSGKFGLLEPCADAETIIPNVIITPLVAFDSRRFRLGYGRGYYDKFFANFEGAKIGLAFELQRAEKIPEEKFDIKLDYIITEDRIY